MKALQQAGYMIECISFFSEKEYETFTSPKRTILDKSGLVATCFLRSLSRALFHKKYDGVYLQREATPFGTDFIERAWTREIPLLVDFDDAIWITNISEEHKRFTWLKDPQKLSKLLRRAKVVTVCNDFLASYAQRYAADVRIIPTTIDTDLYRPTEPLWRSFVTIGWTGSRTTTAYLRMIEGPMRQLYEKYRDKIRFRFIGASGYSPPFPAEILPWQAHTEVEDLQAIDIGVMPLPEEAWSLGKCALKALQYMALGKATVASPVGMNYEVIQEGINGLFARTPAEWVEKISYLIEHPQVRHSLGHAARETVETKYSVRANAQKYIEAFEAAFGT
ncbi:MAG: glycosyltransferase family 4 protein [Bacteroidia bacterium]|nr:glycosyltransferase family 4 protein [Bacteroidia bacterium]